MISYIFKNRYKNAAVIFFAGIYLLIQLKDFYTRTFIYGYISKELLRYVINTVFICSARILPPLLIIIYMLTLKRKYKVKEWLFPAAFAVFSLSAAILIFAGIYEFYKIFSYKQFGGFIEIFTAVGANILIITAYILSFSGSLANFKRVVLLRIGLMISVVCTAVFCALDLKSYYMAFSHLSDQSTFLDFLSAMNYSAELFKQFITLLFYGSMFLLTLCKKGEYIDITPFVEARKNRKEMKKARKEERERELEAVPPEAPEGYWRCMGCGKILPDGETRCECGYKKSADG